MIPFSMAHILLRPLYHEAPAACSQFPAYILAVCGISYCGRKSNEIAHLVDKAHGILTTLR
jgi:hypothetical protein